MIGSVSFQFEERFIGTGLNSNFNIPTPFIPLSRGLEIGGGDIKSLKRDLSPYRYSHPHQLFCRQDQNWFLASD